MKYEHKTEGAEYILDVQRNKQGAKVNLRINARDWKKAGSLDVLVEEGSFPFRVSTSLMFGEEERWDNSDGTVDYDYNGVFLTVRAASKDGKQLYKQEINASGKLNHDITFHLPETAIKNYTPAAEKANSASY